MSNYLIPEYLNKKKDQIAGWQTNPLIYSNTAAVNPIPKSR